MGVRLSEKKVARSFFLFKLFNMKNYIIHKLLKLIDYLFDTDKDTQVVIVCNGDGSITYQVNNITIKIK